MLRLRKLTPLMWLGISKSTGRPVCVHEVSNTCLVPALCYFILFFCWNFSFFLNLRHKKNDTFFSRPPLCFKFPLEWILTRMMEDILFFLAFNPYLSILLFKWRPYSRKQIIKNILSYVWRVSYIWPRESLVNSTDWIDFGSIYHSCGKFVYTYFMLYLTFISSFITVKFEYCCVRTWQDTLFTPVILSPPH